MRSSLVAIVTGLNLAKMREGLVSDDGSIGIFPAVVLAAESLALVIV